MKGKSHGLLISLIVAVVVISWIAAIIMILNYQDRQPDNYRSPILIWLLVPLPFMLLAGIIGAVIWTVQNANAVRDGVEEIRSSLAKQGAASEPPRTSVVDMGSYGFDPATDGPGEYEIDGVNCETKQDAHLTVHADSAANARLKAELDGVVVSSLKRIG